MARLKSRPRCNRPSAVQVWTEPDADYVTLFRALFDQVRTLRKRVPTVPALLRTSQLQFRLGCFWEAKKFAGYALKLDEHCVEGHWMYAISYLAHCEVQLGLLQPGPGRTVVKAAVAPEDEVEAARSALVRYVRLNGRRDEEACALLDALSTIVAARLQGDALRQALAGLVDFTPGT